MNAYLLGQQVPEVELRPVYHCQSRLPAQVIPALLAWP